MKTIENVRVWLDLETTGLDRVEDRILEVGVLVEAHGELYGRGWLVSPVGATVAEIRASVDPYVDRMHAENGLWADLEADGRDRRDVEAEVAAYLGALVPPEGGLLQLCGASVHFDEGFLHAWMPRLCRMFGHRHLDVSALELALAECGYRKPKRPVAHRAHRALEDCYAVRLRLLDAQTWVRRLKYYAEQG